MLSAIGTGKTIEKAIEEALFELKASREDVDIHVLSEGGLFKKAKVEVKISEDAKEKYMKRENFREKVDSILPKEPEKVKANLETLEKNKELSSEERVQHLSDRLDKIKDERRSVAKAETSEKQIVKESVKEENLKKEKTKKSEKQLDPMEFLQGFFKALKLEVTITTLEDDKYITYSIEGEGCGNVIGRHGEGYYALTKLVQATCAKHDKRIILDVDGYRAKREQTLTATALRIANKVAKTGRYMKLDPMNPSERRIIHTALQNDDRVTTLSKGTEPRRYVIIFPKEYKER